MRTAVLVGQVIAALGIFNVWIIRFGKATNWRGGDAKNLKDEFQVYGLPGWSVGGDRVPEAVLRDAPARGDLVSHA